MNAAQAGTLKPETIRPTCKQVWSIHKNNRIADLRKLWRAYQEGEDTAYAKRVGKELGEFHEYGLAFDYVAPNTFGEKQREGYWRYQISWGGPSDEFRFYSSSPKARPHRIEYVFLDWFDGHTRKLTGRDESLMVDVWDFFAEIGSTSAEFNKATEDQ